MRLRRASHGQALARSIGRHRRSAATGENAAELLKHGGYSIILVNRLLAADGSSGLDVIENLLRTNPSIPIMLVSDLPMPQDAAVALGAVRGFGKADLGKPATLELVGASRMGNRQIVEQIRNAIE